MSIYILSTLKRHNHRNIWVSFLLQSAHLFLSTNCPRTQKTKQFIASAMLFKDLRLADYWQLDVYWGKELLFLLRFVDAYFSFSFNIQYRFDWKYIAKNSNSLAIREEIFGNNFSITVSRNMKHQQKISQ